MSAFHARFRFLNMKMSVVFTNVGLPEGLVLREDQTGRRYYTDDGRCFRSLRAALAHRGRFRGQGSK